MLGHEEGYVENVSRGMAEMERVEGIAGMRKQSGCYDGPVDKAGAEADARQNRCSEAKGEEAND